MDSDDKKKTGKSLAELKKQEIILNLEMKGEVEKARKDLTIVEKSLKLTVSLHGNYIDKLGKAATSVGGFYIQINRRIKKSFDHGRKNMKLDEMLLLKSLLVKIEGIIKQGEENHETRKGIKIKVYTAIDKYGDLGKGIAA